MAFYVTDNNTGALLYLSDLEPPPEFIGQGHFEHEVPLTVAQINAGYAYDQEARTFVIRQNITKLQFLRRFTMQERIAIRAAQASDPIINDFMTLLDMAQEISTSDPDTVMGMQYLASQGLLTAERVAEILGG